MSPEPEIEFYIAFNVLGLSLHDTSDWRRRFRKILADLANLHAIHARGCFGAYVADRKTGYRPFYLFSLALDLDKHEELEKYHEVEAKVKDVIKAHLEHI